MARALWHHLFGHPADKTVPYFSHRVPASVWGLRKHGLWCLTCGWFVDG